MIMMDTNSNAGTKEGLVVGGDEVKTWQGEGSSRGGREKGGGAPIDVEVTRKTIFDP